jgi:hypothetical protein
MSLRLTSGGMSDTRTDRGDQDAHANIYIWVTGTILLQSGKADLGKRRLARIL